MEKIFFCTKPFTNVELRTEGSVFVCCCGWTEHAIGNWKTDTFEEIWNGERAKEFRRTILDGSYRFCKLKRCLFYGNNNSFFLEEEISKLFKEICPPPETVDFCHDRICNVRCVMCRDEHIRNSKEATKFLDDKIESVFLPFAANAKFCIMNGDGEALASSHFRKLIKKIVEKSPDAMFKIRSNGLMADKKNFESLGITDKVQDVVISLHASKKKIYNKIVLDSDFNRIIKNIEYLCSERNKNGLPNIFLVSVVSALNYFDMIPFIKMAKKYNSYVSFFEHIITEPTKMNLQYKKMAVFKPWHPKYNKYVRITKKIFKNEKWRRQINTFSPLLFNLEPISLKEYWRYRFEDLKDWIDKLHK
jgi:wyosine [tRNA(Phe)-imidazoG37] synthetase (radical SAM superfamily)